VAVGTDEAADCGLPACGVVGDLLLEDDGEDGDAEGAAELLEDPD